VEIDHQTCGGDRMIVLGGFFGRFCMYQYLVSKVLVNLQLR